jgi:hypothetical protein
VQAWLVSRTFAELLSLAGAVTYGVTYYACVLFYTPFGVEPSDVGLGYGEVLAQAAAFLGFLAVVYLVSLYVGSSLGRMLDSLWSGGSASDVPSGAPKQPTPRYGSRRRPGRVQPRDVNVEPVPSPAPPAHPPARLPPNLVFAGLLLIAVILVGAASVDRRSVQSGHGPAVGLGLLPWGDTAVARVSWIDASSNLPRLPTCVIRLGEAAGTEVLYDPQTSRTLRLPQSSIVVQIRPRSEHC